MSRRPAITSRPSAVSLARLPCLRRRLNHPRDSGGDRGDQGRANHDAHGLSSHRGALACRQLTRRLTVLSFALPECGKHDSRFFASLEKPDRRETNGHGDQQSRLTRRVHHDERNCRERGDGGPDPCAAPATPRSPLSNVVDVLRHHILLSAALRERPLRLGGAREEITRGASLRTRAQTISAGDVGFGEPRSETIVARIELRRANECIHT